MTAAKDDRSYITTPQASQQTGLSKTYLTRLLRNSTLEGFRLGRDWLIYTDSLDRYLAVPHKPGPKGPRKKLAVDASSGQSTTLAHVKKADEC
jgi:excisionase family DNA binding protein